MNLPPIQTTSAINKKLKKSTILVKKYLSTVATDKWLIAAELHTLQVAIPWRMTKYTSYRDFCEQNFNISRHVAYKYASTGQSLIALCYTKTEMKKLCKHFSFSTLAMIFIKLKGRKIPVNVLIKRYKNFKGNTYTKVIKGNKVIVHNQFNFVLNDTHALLLNELLEEYGMRISAKGQKIGASAAMATFLDSI